MNSEIVVLREKMEAAKARYYANAGTYEDMKAAADALAAAMNARGRDIAKKFKMRHKPICAAALLR